MSRTIDERVVEMRFDNKHFESNVNTSISTLDKLKKALHLEKSAQSLEEINKTAKKMDMSPLSNGVESVRMKFSALEVMAVTALSNITNSAVNAGKRLVSAFTIDPIKSGFQEYETQINAVQTILANTSSKGTTIDQVNEALDELNYYADKTIYNFTEMTRNIGTFTAAGIDLETSVNAIQGIANLAAVSGSTSQQASTAMYQLSQALAAGTVKLMDWNSVVNAGMGGEVFQNALRKTSELLGTGAEAAIKAEGSFRESLKTGWLTSEVLTETLKLFTTSGANEYVSQYTGLSTEAIEETMKLATEMYGEGDAIHYAAQALAEKSGKNAQEIEDALQFAKTAEDAATKVKTFSQLLDTLKEAAQSGWTQSWEIIIGDFEEAKELFTRLSDMFGGMIEKSANARNEMLEAALSSNWDKLSKEVTKAGIDLDDFKTKLVETGKEHGVVTDEMIRKAGGFEKSLRSGWLSGDIFRETISKMTGSMSEVTQSTEDMTEKLEYFQKVVNEVWHGDYKNGKERIDALTKAGYDYATVQDLVNKTIDGHKLTLEDLTTEQAANLGMTEEQIKVLQDLAAQSEETGNSINEIVEGLAKPSGRELLIESLFNIINAIAKPLGAIKKAWDSTFGMQASTLYTIIEWIHKMTSALVPSEKTVKNLGIAFKGLFDVLHLFTSFIGGAFKLALNAIASVLGNVDFHITDLAASVGKALSSFHDWVIENGLIEQSLNAIVNVVKNAKEHIVNLVNAFLQLPAVQNGIKKITDYFSGGIKRIQTFIKYVKSFEKIGLSDIPTILKFFKNHVVDYFLDIDLSVEKVKKTFSDFKEKVKDDLEKAGEKFDWLKEKIGTFLAYVREKIPGVIAIGMGAMLIAAIAKISDAIELLMSPLEGLKNLLSSVGEAIEVFGESLGKFLKAKAFEARCKGILMIAGAIAILAGSLALLSKLDQKNLWSSVGAISTLMIVLSGLALAVSKLSGLGLGKGEKGGKSSLIQVSIALIALAGSVAILVGSLKAMGGLNPDNVVRNAIILGGMIAALATAAGLLAHFAPELSKGAITIVAMAVSVKIMVSAMKDLDSANLEHPWKVMLEMVGIVGVMGLLVKACEKVKFSSMAGVLAIAIGLKLMISVMNDIADFDPKKVTDNLSSYLLIFGSLALLMVASKFAGKYAMQAGIGIIAICGALLLINVAIKKLAELDRATIIKGVDAISDILMVFAGVVALSAFAGKYAIRAGAMILMMSGAILILTGVIYLLKDLDPKGLDQAIAAIVKMELAFGALIAITRFAGEAKSLKGTLIALTVAVGVMAGAIYILAGLDKSSLATASAALGSMIAVFSLLVYSTKFIDGKNWWKSMISLIGMTAVVGGLATIIALLSKFDSTSVLSSAAGLSTLLLSLSASITILNKTGPMAKEAYVAALGMVLITGLLAAIIGILAQYEVDNALEIAASLSVLILSLSGACVLLGMAGGYGPTALIGLGILAAVITGVGALMTAIGALVEKFPALETFLDKGIDILNKIGYGLGSFFGNIIGGFSEGITAGLPGIGQNLADFMTNAQPFFDGISSVSTEALEGVKNLGSMMATLAGANITDWVASMITGQDSMSKFSSDLKLFGDAMVDFSNTVAGNIDASAIEAAANAGKMMTELANTVPRMGGVVGFFAGDKDLGTFSSQLELYGDAITKFSKKVSKEGAVNEEAITAAKNAGMIMVELANSLPNTGGVVQWFTGERDLGTFGSQLQTYGEALVSFSKTVSEEGAIDETAITAAKNTGLIMVELSKSVPKMGGVLNIFRKNNDLSTFGSQLESYGEAIVKFSKSLTEDGGIDLDAIDKASKAGFKMVDLANSMPSEDNIDNIKTFSSNISAIGDGMKGFSDSLSEVDTETMTVSVNNANAILRFINGTAGLDTSGIPTFVSALNDLGNVTIDGFVNAFANSGVKISAAISTMMNYVVNGISVKAPLISMAFNNVMTTALNAISTKQQTFYVAGFNAMTQFSNGITAGGANTSSAISSFIQRILSSIQGSQSTFNSAGRSLMQQFYAGLLSGSQSSYAMISNTVDRIVTYINGRQQQFYQVGVSLMTRFNTGITSVESKVHSTILKMVTKAMTTINSKQQQFYTAGTRLMGRFVSALKSKNSAVKNAVSSAISSASSAIKAKYQDFYSAGKYLAQGFANGIRGNFTAVTSAAVAMANAAIIAAKKKLDLNSPSKVFEEIGAYTVEGFAIGIEEKVGLAANAAVQMGSSVLNAFKDFFQIHSPSLVMKENGEYIVQGLADGIKSNTTAEDAAKKKAQNVVDAFKKELDKFSLDQTTAELEYNLWDATYGETASEADRTAKKVEMLTTKLTKQTERVRLAEAEHAYTCKIFGESSEEAQEAYNKLLEEQTKFADLQRDLKDATQDNFNNVIDRLEEDQSIAELEYELWQAENSYTMNKNDLTLKITELLTTKLAKQQEIVTNAQKKYQKACEDYGKESSEARAAYQDLLDAQLDLVNINDQIQNAEKGTLQEILNQIDKTYENAVGAAQHLTNLVDKYEQLTSNLLGNTLTPTDLAGETQDFLDLIENRLENEYELWTTQNQDSADAAGAKSEYLNKKLAIETQRLSVLKDEYSDIAKEYGESSYEARQAYNDYLESQIKVQEIQNEIKENGSATLSTELFTPIPDQVAISYNDTAKAMNNMKKTIVKFGRSSRSMLKITANYQMLAAAKEKYESIPDKSSAEARQAYEDLIDIQNQLVENTNELGDILNLDDAGKTMMSTLNLAIGDNWPLIENTVGELMKGISPLIDDLDIPDEIKKTLKKGFENFKLSDILSSFLPEGGISEVIKMLFEGFNIEEALGWIADGAVKLFGSMGVDIAAIFGDLGAGISGIMGNIGTGLMEVAAMLGPEGLIVAAVIAAVLAIGGILYATNDDFKEAVDNTIGVVIGFFQDLWDYLGMFVDWIWNVLIAPFRWLAELFGADFSGYDASRAVTNQQRSVNIAQRAYANAVKDYGAQSTQAQEARNKLLEEENKLKELQKKADELNAADKAEEELRAEKKKLTAAQEAYSKAVNMYGVESAQAHEAYNKLLEEELKLQELQKKVEELRKKPTTGGSGNSSTTKSSNYVPLVTENKSGTIGEAVVNGLMDGLLLGPRLLWNAGVALGEAITGGTKESLDINSPSKVFEEIGKQVNAGLGVGLKEYSSIPELSAEEMVNGVVESASSAVNALSNIEEGPTIRPVIDMDTVDTRNLQLKADVDASLTRPIGSFADLVSKARADIQASNVEVINAINGLRNDLASLYESDGQEIGLYVDGKKLASSLAKPMNHQLNILSKRGAY